MVYMMIYNSIAVSKKHFFLPAHHSLSLKDLLNQKGQRNLVRCCQSGTKVRKYETTTCFLFFIRIKTYKFSIGDIDPNICLFVCLLAWLLLKKPSTYRRNKAKHLIREELSYLVGTKQSLHIMTNLPVRIAILTWSSVWQNNKSWPKKRKNKNWPLSRCSDIFSVLQLANYDVKYPMEPPGSVVWMTLAEKEWSIMVFSNGWQKPWVLRLHV